MSDLLDIRTRVIALVQDTSSKLTKYTPTVWSAALTVAANDRIKPTTSNYVGHTFIAGGAGTTGATEPTWPTNAASSTTDNNITWTEDSDAYDRNINNALGVFSVHKPRIINSQVTGDGTQSYSTPTGWVNEFSKIIRMEYPSSTSSTLVNPPNIVANDKYFVYLDTDGSEKIRFRDETPATTEKFRVTFTAKRTVSTIPDGNIEAFVWLATSNVLYELAAYYAHTMISNISVDSVDYAEKDRIFSDRAARYREMYNDAMGVNDEIKIPAQHRTYIDRTYPLGTSRLTHSNLNRRTRGTGIP